MPLHAPRDLQQLQRAFQAYQARDLRSAAMLCEALLTRDADPRPLTLLARVRMELRDEPQAVALARRATALAPADAGAWFTLASAALNLGLFEESEAAWRAALRARPGDASLLAGLGQTLLHQGRHEDAHAVLAAELTKPAPAPEPLACFARLAARLGRRDEALRLLSAAIRRTDIGPRELVNLEFLYAGLLDEAQRFDEAFAVAERANARKLPRPGVPEYAAAVDALLRAWTRDVWRAVPAGDPQIELPVFIVGMPRSGTSLVEQIVASHPDVHGAGELTIVRGAVEALQPRENPWKLHLTEPGRLSAAGMREAAAGLLAGLRSRGGEKQRVSDKNPLNFMHLGLISRLFPRARVIHCRRDALDTCLSCFLQNFQGPHIFNSELTMLGRWHRQYERVMQHWSDVLETPLLHVEYEQLVREPAAETRRIIEFLGLPWDERCLRYHETRRVTLTPSVDQVTRPMYASSVGRWRHYEAHLGPLRAALGR